MKKFHFSRRHKVLLAGFVLCLGAVAVFYLLAQRGIAIACPFYKITGLLCPGCGNSRAALALLRWDLPAAFGYNPLFALEFFYLAWVLGHCARAYLKGKPFAYKPPVPLLDIGILILLLCWWIVRNCI